jgi:hypothetical protein
LRELLMSQELRTSLRARALAAAGTFTRATLGRHTLAVYTQAIAARRAARSGGPS